MLESFAGSKMAPGENLAADAWVWILIPSKPFEARLQPMLASGQRGRGTEGAKVQVRAHGDADAWGPGGPGDGDKERNVV